MKTREINLKSRTFPIGRMGHGQSPSQTEIEEEVSVTEWAALLWVSVSFLLSFLSTLPGMTLLGPIMVKDAQIKLNDKNRSRTSSWCSVCFYSLVL